MVYLYERWLVRFGLYGCLWKLCDLVVLEIWTRKSKTIPAEMGLTSFGSSLDGGNKLSDEFPFFFWKVLGPNVRCQGAHIFPTPGSYWLFEHFKPICGFQEFVLRLWDHKDRNHPVNQGDHVLPRFWRNRSGVAPGPAGNSHAKIPGGLGGAPCGWKLLECTKRQGTWAFAGAWAQIESFWAFDLWIWARTSGRLGGEHWWVGTDAGNRQKDFHRWEEPFANYGHWLFDLSVFFCYPTLGMRFPNPKHAIHII